MYSKSPYLLFLMLFTFGYTSWAAELMPQDTAIKVTKDIKWASPEGFDLTMDIYTPDRGKDAYPVIIMYHGGGWLINNKSIMDQSAAYLAKHGEYVVCNVNYRLLVDQQNTVKMNEIVEDALGAVLWVKAHIAEYGGDPSKIIVTGDSAGGHLATMVATQGHRLSANRFQGTNLGFQPSWLPEGKTADDIANEGGIAVQAAMISYGAFDMHASAKIGGFEKESNFFWVMGQAKPRGIFGNEINVEEHPEYYKAVSPIYNIVPHSEKDYPPMLFTVGEKDDLTTPASIQQYIGKLKEAGHDDLDYWVHEGRPHAFLDSGSNEFLGISFEKDAPPALDVMIAFLDKVFYAKK